MSSVALPSTPALSVAPRRLRDATTEAHWVKWTLIGVALAFLTVFLFVPLAIVFVEALKKGVGVYLAAIMWGGLALRDPRLTAALLGHREPRS